jgi:hypothetical protein
MFLGLLNIDSLQTCILPRKVCTLKYNSNTFFNFQNCFSLRVGSRSGFFDKFEFGIKVIPDFQP